VCRTHGRHDVQYFNGAIPHARMLNEQVMMDSSGSGWGPVVDCYEQGCTCS